jgi:hypothetical protein
LIVSHDHLHPYPFLLELPFFIKKILSKIKSLGLGLWYL